MVDPAHDQLRTPGGADPAGMPPGPWLLVVGMHRSGTSALTGACAALGLQAPSVDDRMDWPESNPEHWESLALALHDYALLHHLEGSWDAPPDLPPGWELGSAIRPVPPPGPAAARAYPEPGPLVWKDPRACLLLPYWRRVLPSPPAALLVWRPPMAVARSLRARDGLALAHGLALWERYNRSALENLAGVDTYVVDYDALLDDPGPELGRIAAWISGLAPFAPFAGSWEPGAMAAHLSSGLRHQSGDTEDELVLPSQRRLAAILAGLGGGHRPLDAGILPPESGWTTALIEGQRALWLRTRRVGTLEDEVNRLRGASPVTATAGPPAPGAGAGPPAPGDGEGATWSLDALAGRLRGVLRRLDGDRTRGAAGSG